MSPTEDAIRLLSGVGEADRRWILENLPASARARLAEQVEIERDDRAGAAVVEDPASTSQDEGFEWDRAVARLCAVDGAAVARALQSEPAWLLHALLGAADWPWSRQVKKSLHAGLRAELVTLEHAAMRLGGPVTRALVRELAQRSLEWPLASPPRSPVRMLIERLRGGGVR